MKQDQEMTVADLNVKFKSKTELYNVLLREANVYLPLNKIQLRKKIREVMLGHKLHVK